MPQVHVRVQHERTQAEAIVRITHMIETLQVEHQDQVTDLRQTWQRSMNDFSFSAMNMKFSGICLVTSGYAEIKLEIPWAATFLKGQIESTIRKKMGETLS